jgi:hypothetical protein
MLMWQQQFHRTPDTGPTSGGRGFCRYRSEANAYQNLQKFGVCDRGHVPHFYGSLERLDPALFAPHLDIFLRDKQPPSAILLEYLSNAQQLNCENYSEERMDKAVTGITEIHSAYVEHNDPYPKNILIVPGSLERVVWIDFDIAITYNVESLTFAEKQGLDYETEVVKSFGRLLVGSHAASHAASHVETLTEALQKTDQEQGLPPNTEFY